ncbi:MAG: AbrB/MazE/SpoVT family DNA-binding domain-containing protein [Rhodocyclaceae bacterium]|nr:AbrB/MazE/SpoVT family DNA-binding domain-containing protein [Rhodocyclaceae bacterium]
MATRLTIKGQVTIPKHIRDALGLVPGSLVDFAIDDRGKVVVERLGPERPTEIKDRFSAAVGKADIRWRTDDLMRFLRGED